MVEPGERRWAVWFGVLVMLALSLPYLLGFFFQGSAWRYSGLLFASEDGYSYLAKMMRGSSGEWLFRTPYTVEAQRGFLAFLPYLLLGKLTSPPGQYEQLAALFHVLRFVGGVLAALAAYDFAALFIEGVRWRRVALVAITLGGGLGFLSLMGLSSWWKGPMPLEFYSPESFGFLGFLAIPHLSWARALLLWGLARFLRSARWQDGLSVGGLWLLMGFFQPLVVAVAWALLGAFLGAFALLVLLKQAGTWAAWRRWLWTAVAAGLISSPVVIYNVVSFQLDPFLARWQAQNILPSPPPGDYLLAYGLALIPMGFGLRRCWQQRDPHAIFALAWVCAFPVLAYLPYNLQRRLPEGIWALICVLVVLGLQSLRPFSRKALGALFALGALPSLILLWVGIRATLAPGRPLFLPAAEVAAFRFLGSEARVDDVVLASYGVSTALPAYAPVRVPIGHGPESLGLREIQPRVEQFFTTAVSDSDRLDLLETFHVRYVFWGPQERALGGWEPSTAPYLAEVYANQDYAIYAVTAAP